MSASDNRKSMDDVLASIRRIVRAEKEPDVAEPGTGGSQRWDDDPLPLTPDMRMDRGDVEPEAISRPGDAGQVPFGWLEGNAAVPDRDALKELVREVLLEELAQGAAEEAVRELVRDELINGEIGRNISHNVLQLIQTEVEKALARR